MAEKAVHLVVFDEYGHRGLACGKKIVLGGVESQGKDEETVVSEGTRMTDIPEDVTCGPCGK